MYLINLTPPSPDTHCENRFFFTIINYFIFIIIICLLLFRRDTLFNVCPSWPGAIIRVLYVIL